MILPHKRRWAICTFSVMLGSPLRCATDTNRVAAMQQVADWLKQLGMSEYAERFVESDIDTSVLRDLTDQDLKELGVSLGHRRKMLRAIAELVAVPPIQLQPALTEPKPKDTAQRRQVTVMFSDLVGSTALAARMDPEDLREIISAYQKCVAETVQRFGGFVAKYMGDGVLVYYGYPQAHEDDAERAVRSGLELVQGVGRSKSSAPLQTRVGIATGSVVVGDLIGSGVAQERGIVGETPNVAARLQSIAEPNTVVIAEAPETPRQPLRSSRPRRTRLQALTGNWKWLRSSVCTLPRKVGTRVVPAIPIPLTLGCPPRARPTAPF
jgi:class 3 adenylate cyclase